MKEKNFIVNDFGLRIKKCCASCAFKELEGTLTPIRQCTLTEEEVEAKHLCPMWELREALKKAGSQTGRVKRGEYLRYLLNVRFEEQEEIKNGKKIKEKTIEEVQIEFEKEHGSIYIN